MKRIIAFALLFALLVGCAGGHETEVTVGAPKDPTPEPEPLGETVQIEYVLHYTNMSLELLDGWNHVIIGGGVDDGEIHAGLADTFGIRFWPEEVSDGTEGTLALYYYMNGFGVCGTGLKSEDVIFDSGLTASVGTYDNNPVWSFVSFQDTPGNYVVMNEGADAWWSEYGAQAMSILNTIRVGEKILSQSEAVSLAEAERTVKYNRVRADFDAISGEWTIQFYHSDTTGVMQTVWITSDGVIRDVSTTP